MNQDEMYEHMRAQVRGTSVTALEALHKTLTAAGSSCRPFFKGDKHLYVRCDGMPSTSIRQVDFLVGANNLTWRVEAFNTVFEFEGTKEYLASPYIHIYKEVKS